jgi:hypothetical protein
VRPGTIAQIDAARARQLPNCAVPYRGDDGKIYDAQTGLVCGEPAAPGTPGGEVSLTPGRQLTTPTQWNVWTDAVHTSSSDHRYGLDMGITTGALTMGMDHRFTDDFVAGAMLSLQRSNSDGFDNLLTTDTTGFTIGPYAAWRMSPHWAVSAAISYGETRTELGVVVLNSIYTSPQYSASGGAYAQYSLGDYQIRPQYEMFYIHTNNPAYTMSGPLLERVINVPLPAFDFDYANAQLSAEINRAFTTTQNNFIMPYGEFGTQLEFVRPYGGAILTGELAKAIPSPWSFWLRTGLRASVADRVVIQGQAGYLSLGQAGLNSWEGELRLSVAF